MKESIKAVSRTLAAAAIDILVRPPTVLYITGDLRSPPSNYIAKMENTIVSPGEPTLKGVQMVIDEKLQPAVSHQLAWSGITYEIPIPAPSRKAKKAQKLDVEAAARPPPTRRILDGLEGHVNAGEMVAILGASVSCLM